jgi:hypothetical protein
MRGEADTVHVHLHNLRRVFWEALALSRAVSVAESCGDGACVVLEEWGEGGPLGLTFVRNWRKRGPTVLLL